jgi:Tfp pilus assembly protein PilV
VEKITMPFKFTFAKRIQEESGVSIIEVLISLTILAIGILAVAKMQVSTARNTTNGNILTLATMLANRHLEQIKSIEDLSDLDDALHPLVVTQRFDEQGNSDASGLFEISTTVATASAPVGNLARDVAVTVSWNRRWGVNRQITLRTVTQGNGV